MSLQEVNCYHVLKSEVKDLSSESGNILSPDLAVPVKMGHLVTRSHAALHILGKGN